MDIGSKIKRIRESKGMTMYRLTQITGISGHHIKGIEDGTRQPTIDTLQRLLVPLGISMAELFSEETDRVYLTEHERRLLENFRTLTEEKQNALLLMSDVLR